MLDENNRVHSNNCLPPEFKRTSFEKRNNLEELINIPVKTEEKPIIQISFRSQDPNIKTGRIRNPRPKLQPIHDPLCFQNPRIRSIFRTNPQSARFLRPNPSIPKIIHPPLLAVRHNRKREISPFWLAVLLKDVQIEVNGGSFVQQRVSLSG